MGFSCHVSLLSLNPEQFPSLLGSGVRRERGIFHGLDILKESKLII